MKKTRQKIWAIAIRLALIVIIAVVFHGFRYFMLFVGVVLILVDLIRHISPIKRKVMLVLLDLAVILFAVSTYWINEPIEHLRFRVMEGQYSAAVEEALPTVKEFGNTEWSSFKLKTLVPLSLKNEIEFWQFEDSTAFYFPTFISFFTSAGFIYFSDETARDFTDNPADYFEGIGGEPLYDYIYDYDQNWAFIVLY